MENDSQNRYYCYTDAGGTFTDTLLIDQSGDMWSGKAPTTPASLDEGHIASIEAALAGLGITMRDLLSRAEVIAFGTTAIINTIVQRSGAHVGAIITKGFERVPSIGRACQNYSEYSWGDILHSGTHRHLQDLVAYQDIVGVTERIDANGKAFIPLYEHEVREAVDKLIDKNVESIIILFLYSYMNPSHELRAKEIAEEIIKRRGAGTRVFTSYEISPTMKELSRFNTLAVEAYAGDIARKSLAKSEERLVALGAKTRLQATLSHGGLMPAAYAHMVDTAMSGPAGGILGGKYLGDVYGYKNIITSDVGGTSFDVGLITGGRINIKTEPVVARFILSAPCAEVTSIGAGGGTMAYLDPFTNRLKVGPQSAGSVPGPACYGKGGENPTVTDADLVLGYIDPGYFLGGRMKLDKSLAEKAIKEKIADPLGLSVIDAATGIKEIIDAEMENYCRSLISTRGYAVEDYVLLAFGGAGPTHVAGYTKNTKYKEVVVTPFASVFCAFGGATADYSRQYLRATRIYVPYKADEETKLKCAQALSDLWADLEDVAKEEMAAAGFNLQEVEFEQLAFTRYAGQLDEIVFGSPHPRLRDAKALDDFVDAFESEYSSVYTSTGRYPQAGYLTLHVGLVAKVSKPKPVIAAKAAGAAGNGGLKGTRTAVFDRMPMDTAVYEMSELSPGQTVQGPAIIEHIDTTFVVPPDSHVDVDQYGMLFLRRA
ncbi:MAG: hydantoinase/oxoprolinase family protein [Thermoleophilia bacterium]|nr:hydantoinase/oxoprolinase family protein [Thermoleophilia bacterium]